MRILPRIDWDLLRRHPRAYVGYSDLTPFLLEVARRSGLVAFHGPMVAADLARGLNPDEEESLLGALAGRYPAEQPFAGWLREPTGREVRGTLLGGCLSLLAATLGTPFAPDLDAGIVFWEDVDEPPYRIDRMLTHLGLSGNLANIAGMIVGSLGEGQEPDGTPVDWSINRRGRSRGLFLAAGLGARKRARRPQPYASGRPAGQAGRRPAPAW